MKNNEILKKQIIYRSIHRGTKEMDILLGRFVRKNIDKLNEADLVNLNQLLVIEDEIIFKWYFEKKTDYRIPKNKVSEMLRVFKI